MRITPIILLLTLMTASILTGCARQVAAQVNEVTPPNRPPTLEPTTLVKDIPKEPPASCLITRPQNPQFIPPEPYLPEPPEAYADQFWYGSAELWTMLGTDGIWHALPHGAAGYSQKVFWWSRDFDVNAEPSPNFTVTGERLDVPASTAILAEQATNASADFGTAMLTGVAIPDLGCWKITGTYKDAELSFVVWVAP